jgi:hypothetical protein
VQPYSFHDQRYASVKITAPMTVLLYLATALTTATQVYFLTAWSMWRAPITSSQYIALVGSFVLLVAALMVRWIPRLATILALCSCVLIWCFYAPALVYTLSRLPSIPELRTFLPSLALSLVPAILLALSSFRAVRSLVQRKASVS